LQQEQQATPWFALHIRMHDHANVETALNHKGYDVFAPSYVATRISSGREKHTRTPLFPGYLFCSLDPQHRLPVLKVPGVIRILGLGGSVTPVPTHEIESIRRTITSGLPFESFRLLEPGEPVEVKSGPLAGVKGMVVYHKGKYRVVITVTALNDRAVSVEVDRAALAHIDAPALAMPQMPDAVSVRPWQLPMPDLRAAARDR
jgi:transcription antitermination factor NusG